MPALHELVPDVDTLIQMEPEEVAGVLLEALPSTMSEHGGFSPWGFAIMLFGGPEPAYPVEKRAEVLRAVGEAFAYLESQGLMLPIPGSDGSDGFRVLSRRGKRIKSQADWSAYRKASMLPKDLVHSRILDLVYFQFLRGDYSTAVFQAFREVEIAVRAGAGLADTDIGRDLMVKAFKPDTGALADTSQPRAEQESLMQLFAAAIGSYKNPHSHRTVAINDPAEAVEMIMLASHLLRIVDTRAERSGR